MPSETDNKRDQEKREWIEPLPATFGEIVRTIVTTPPKKVKASEPRR